MRAATSKSWSSGMIPMTAALLCALLAGCSRYAATSSAIPELTPAQREHAELVQQGKRIFDRTPKYASAWVGNKLACGDCHIQSGAAAHAAPMIDLAGLFPMFNKRAGHIISLQNRIQECFSRSEAGKPLPEDSPQMRALVAYIDWLSRSQVDRQPYTGRGFIKLPVLSGDPVRGKAVFASQCAGCHGSDGAGLPPILPALWGPDSYNDGAGMNNLNKMAAFVAYNMPQNAPGTLTPRQAYDVAAFVHTMPRPKFNKAYRNY